MGAMTEDRTMIDDRRQVTVGGLTFDIHGPPFQSERFMTEHIRDRRERKIAQKMIEEPGWFAELPVTPGAIEGVAELVEAFDVWLCTKPMESNPTCHGDKANWIKRYFPDLHDRLMIVPDKSMVHGDILIDDAPKVEWLDHATWSPIIFRTPFNGPGSDWGHLPSWTWGDPIDILLEAAS